MLALKLTIVPLFIAVITLAGRRWGATLAGLLGGLPVVAGPIVVFVALEQGQQFGALSAVAAMSAIAGLLAFGIAYTWASIRWSWPVALSCALVVWAAVAAMLSILPAMPAVALGVAALSLVLTPCALPTADPPSVTASKLNDLPYRMATGGLLTVGVTSAAASLGEAWSGILAVFPVIGVVLSVFTHRAQGAAQVAQIYRGMVRGLYSFAVFFLTLAILLPRTGLWLACLIAAGAALIVQAVAQWLVWPRLLRQGSALNAPGQRQELA